MRGETSPLLSSIWLPAFVTSFFSWATEFAEQSGIVMPRKVDNGDRLQRVVVCPGGWKGEKKEEREQWISEGGMLLLLSFAVFLVYISYGYLQESVVSEPGFTFMEFMTLWQNFSYFLCALIDYMILDNGFRELMDAMKKPEEAFHHFFLECRKYFAVGLMVTAGTGLSNFSFRFLSFPVQQIFKSCKLLPVMIARMLFIENDFFFV